MEKIHYDLFFKLKEAVEKRLYKDEKTPGLEKKSIYYISKKLSEHIEVSESQLEKIWSWKPTEDQPYIKMSDKTLEFLLGFIECQTLKEFKESLVYRSAPEKNIDLGSIIPDDIEAGKEITIGWYPVKYCKLEKGEHPYEFRVLESVGFKRKAGNVFYAPGFYISKVEGQEYPDILIDSDTGWFDEDQQSDLKNQKDYLIL